MTEITPTSILVHVEELLAPNQELQSRIIDLSRTYPEIEYLFERDGQPCFSRGDIQAIKGKAKSGKSTFMIALLCSLLTGENMGFKALKAGYKAMYIDTEQNPINTAKMIKKVHHICGFPLDQNNDLFSAINLRGDTPRERKKFIREALEIYNPDFIILDGIKDIIEGGDINSPTESGEAIQFLMNITKEFNAAVLTVLHENKKDDNMRGHIGSELLNKCSEAWQIVKTDNVFTAEQIENRNNVSGSVNFSFEFGDDHLPILVESVPQAQGNKTLQTKIESFYWCLPNGTRRSYKNLISEYCERYGCKEKTAEKDVAKFLGNGYLLKDDASKDYRFNVERLPITCYKQDYKTIL